MENLCNFLSKKKKEFIFKNLPTVENSKFTENPEKTDA